MTGRTYHEIAADYNLWIEYVDPSGLDSERAFNDKSEEEKVTILVRCFGPEKPQAMTAEQGDI